MVTLRFVRKFLEKNATGARNGSGQKCSWRSECRGLGSPRRLDKARSLSLFHGQIFSLSK